MRSLLIAIALGVVAAAFWRLVVPNSLLGQRWYRLVYRALYVVGLRVWERRTSPSDLLELIEGPNALPPARALDLGCGTGTDSIYLAQHGWDVTGIDMVP